MQGMPSPQFHYGISSKSDDIELGTKTIPISIDVQVEKTTDGSTIGDSDSPGHLDHKAI
jgi:hypothetical protein